MAGIVCKMEKLPILTTAVDYVYTMQAAINEKLQKQAQLRAQLALMQGYSCCVHLVVVLCPIGCARLEGWGRGGLWSLFAMMLTNLSRLPEQLAALKARAPIESRPSVSWFTFVTR